MNNLDPKTNLEDEIQNKYIKPSYIRDVKDFTDDRYKYRVWGYRFEFFGKILTGAATTAAFAASGFKDFEYGSFISGALGVLAMTFQHLSSFSLGRSRENTEQLNQTLQSINIDMKIPDVIPKEEDHEEKS